MTDLHSSTSTQAQAAERVSFDLTLSRWHNVAKRLANLASEAAGKAQSGLGGTRVEGYAGPAQIQTLSVRKSEAQAGLELSLDLQGDISAIREAIGQANAQMGVAALLARHESLNRSIKLLRDIIAAQTAGMVPLDGLESYKPISQGEGRHYYRGGDEGGIAVSLLDDGELQGLKARLAVFQAKAFKLTDDINDQNRAKVSVLLTRKAALLSGLLSDEG